MDLLLSAELKSWLLKSIPGIITLGAVGSIIATGVVFCLKKMATLLINSKDKIIIRLLYPYMKTIECSEKIRDAHSIQSGETKYLAYAMFEMFMWLSLAVLFFLSLLATLFIYLLFKIEKPILLSSFIGINFYYAYKSFKHGIYIVSLLSNETLETKKAIDQAQPKSFSEWKKKFNNPPPKP